MKITNKKLTGGRFPAMPRSAMDGYYSYVLLHQRLNIVSSPRLNIIPSLENAVRPTVAQVQEAVAGGS